MNQTASIGTARLLDDGTILLQLRAEGPNGLLGDGQISYPTGHPNYQEVMQHLGGLRKGEEKLVPPWPE